VLAAIEAGLDVTEYCRQQHVAQKTLYERYNLSFDAFGRSSSLENHRLTQHMASKLEQAGFIEERDSLQMYSPTDDRFLPDRYVIGSCPHCGNPNARGDQCEACTKLLDPQDLIEPRSVISGSTDLELRKTRHLFLLQSKLTDEIDAWLETRDDWPASARSIANGWIREGLRDRSITRDLEWGVPVDRPGFEKKVFYVWFDAPIEYIAATQEWANNRSDTNWQSWWYDATDVVYTQFMAKDNVPFHAVSFPATLIGSREPWKLVDKLKGFQWLKYYGDKFSTSRKRGIFMPDAIELLPSDYWRWYLLANAPDNSDTDFTWDELKRAVNKELADVLGNFLNRTIVFADRYFDRRVPDIITATERESLLFDELLSSFARYQEAFDALEFRRLTSELLGIWRLGNEYFSAAEPWRLVREGKVTEAGSVIRRCLELAVWFGVLSEPIIPDISARLRSTLKTARDQPRWPSDQWRPDDLVLATGSTIGSADQWFDKITDDQVAAWTSKFGGH
jgi:methionyl-tRNA synthetase